MAGEFERPLGRLAMNFGFLEYNLLSAIEVLASIKNDPVPALTRQQRFWERVESFEALAKEPLEQVTR